MKSLICLAVAAIAVVGSTFAQQTKILTAEKHNEYGLVYTLPITELQITVTAECTKTFAGPFAQYARKYIGTDNAVTENTTTWKITGVEVAPYGKANTDTKYLMQLKPGATTYLGVAGDGMLLSINAPVPEFDYDSESIETYSQEIPQSTFNANAYLQYVTEEFLSSQSTARQAQMLSESIMELRETKLSLTHGTAEPMPADGLMLQQMLNSLTAQEKAMMDAFLGHTESYTVQRTYTYTPSKEGRSVLLRISDFDGLTDADDFAGEPLYISLKVTDTPELPRDEKGEEKKLPRDAVMYNIPGSAQVILSYRGQELFNSNIRMAQYGVTFGLNPQLFTDKKSPSYAIFDAATGAVKLIGPVSELQKEN